MNANFELNQQWHRLHLQPSLFIVDHFDSIVNEIDLECESLIEKNHGDLSQIAQFNQIRHLMIDKIREHQIKCLAACQSEFIKPADHIALFSSDTQNIQAIDAEIHDLKRRYLLNKNLFFIRNQSELMSTSPASTESNVDVSKASDADKTIQSSNGMGHLVILENVFLTDFQIILFSLLFKRRGTYFPYDFLPASDYIIRRMITDAQDLILESLKCNNQFFTAQNVKCLDENLLIVYQFFKKFSFVDSSESASAPPESFIIEYDALNLLSDHQAITELHLDSGLFTSIQQGLFADKFSSVVKLNLAHNELTSLDQLGDNLKCLHALTDLNLAGNQLECINEDAFKSLVNLKLLNLESNRISEIHRGAFNDLKKLTKLRLGFNCIEKLEDGIFSGLESLLILKLNKNQIASISQHTFQGLNSLKLLNLDVNKLTHLPDNVFKPLTMLTELVLSQNAISLVGPRAFDGLVKLQTLSLWSNQLESLNKNWFQHKKMLNSLYLFDNRVTKIDPSTFSELVNLKILNLSFNKLNDLPENIFKMNLKILDVRNNEM